MFLRQMSIEIRKTLKHPALWIGLAVLLTLHLLFTIVRHSQIKYGFVPGNGGLEQDLLAGLSFYNWIGGFIYAVTASVITAYDYPDLRLWLSRGISRPLLLSARLAVILLMTLSIISLSNFLSLGLAVISRRWFFGAVDASHLNTTAIFPIVLRTFWSSLPYLALTILLAILSRSPIFAAGGTILYIDIFEKLLLSLSDRYPLLTRYLPGGLALALQARNYTVDLATPPIVDIRTLTIPSAAFAISIIFVGMCCLSFLIFSRQDLGGSE